MRYILLATAALFFTACGSGSSSPTPSTPTTPTPTTPTPTTASPTVSSLTTSWTVTHRFASVTGADNCWVRQQRDRLTGVVFSDMDMTVTRSSGAITIESEWFVTYTGTMTGEEFTARKSRPLEGSGPKDCSGTTIFQQPGVSTLSGRFASDDQTLSGTESNVYPLNTGARPSPTTGIGKQHSVILPGRHVGAQRLAVSQRCWRLASAV